MTTTTRLSTVAAAALNHFGADRQLNKVAEECAELIQALCRYRDEPSESATDNLGEELADVVIMTRQLYLYIQKHAPGLIERKLGEKLSRLERLVSGG